LVRRALDLQLAARLAALRGQVEPVLRRAGPPGGPGVPGVQGHRPVRQLRAEVEHRVGRGDDADLGDPVPAPGEQAGHLVRPAGHAAHLVPAVGDDEDVARRGGRRGGRRLEEGLGHWALRERKTWSTMRAAASPWSYSPYSLTKRARASAYPEASSSRRATASKRASASCTIGP